MKVFDFSDGKKGRLLGDVTYAGANGRWYNDRLIDADSVNIDRYKFNTPIKPGGERIKPEDFGVEAICYCIGQLKNGSWDWEYAATWEWLKVNTNFKFEQD